MLTITVPNSEWFNEKTSEFVSLPGATLNLEHSLVSFSKWESFFEKPFLNDKEMTTEEVNKYIEFMCLDPNFPPGVFSRLTSENRRQISDYIDKQHTATWFNENVPGQGSGRAREVITAELFYYWMSTMGIPWEAQYWHLNRLLTLLKVFSLKNAPAKKMTRAEQAQQMRALNAARRKQYNTNG